MIDDLIVRMKAALAKASNGTGPYIEPDDQDECVHVMGGDVVCYGYNRQANAECVALLRNHAAELIERLESAEAEVQNLASESNQQEACLGVVRADRDQWKARAEKAEALVVRDRQAHGTGRADELRLVVAWLRKQELACGWENVSTEPLADAIERGEHRK